ncbi:hypothetical protein HDU98_011555 [Podochytrium sp. JEL0797]|nr:hypothetical protein HDU98_011555 [Podochytrium sp. JEL0797]
MLTFIKTNAYYANTDPLQTSVFADINADYANVISQIESIVADDCLQLIIESMWQFDKKKWSGDTVVETTPHSPELTDALHLLQTTLTLFQRILPATTRLSKSLHRALLARLMDRLLTRPISMYNFSWAGAMQVERDVEAVVARFSGVIVKQTPLVKRMRETLMILVMDSDDLVALFQQLLDPEVVGARVLEDVGIRHLSVDEVKSLTKRRVA